MSESRQDEPKQQIFHGPASFGGDNHGIINNILIDAQTRAALAKMSRDTPALGRLMEKAFRDGFISPDAVIALNRAVEHLNEDTVQAFMFAAKHINEETAISFEGVARDFTVADEQLRARVTELNNAAEALGMMVRQINDARPVRESGYQAQSSRATGMAKKSSGRSVSDWWITLQLMCFCLGVGLLTTAILTHYRLGGDAQRIGGIAAAVPIFIWVYKLLQWMSARKDRVSGTPRLPRLPR
jgi:hypothetical protein